MASWTIFWAGTGKKKIKKSEAQIKSILKENFEEVTKGLIKSTLLHEQIRLDGPGKEMITGYFFDSHMYKYTRKDTPHIFMNKFGCTGQREGKVSSRDSSSERSQLCMYHTYMYIRYLLNFSDEEGEEEETREGEQKGAPFQPHHTHTHRLTIRLPSLEELLSQAGKEAMVFRRYNHADLHMESIVSINSSGGVRITLCADKKKGIWILKIKDRMFFTKEFTYTW